MMKSMMLMMGITVMGMAMASAPAFAGEACCPSKKAATTQPAKVCKCEKDAACKGQCETCKCEAPVKKA